MNWLQSMGLRGSETIALEDEIPHTGTGNVSPQPIIPHVPQFRSKSLFQMAIEPQRQKQLWGIGVLKHYRPEAPQVMVSNTGGQKTVIIGNRYRRGFVADNPNLARQLRAGDYRKDDSVVQVGAETVNPNVANSVQSSNRYRR